MVNAKLIAVTTVLTIAVVSVLAVVYKSGGGSSAYATVGDICADVENPSVEVEALCKDLGEVGVKDEIFCVDPSDIVYSVADDDAGLMAAVSADTDLGSRTVQCSDVAYMCTAEDGDDNEDPDVTPERVAMIKQYCQTSCSIVSPDAKPPANTIFTMDEILSAPDVNAKWEEVQTRCGGQHDRRLEEIEEKILAQKAERALSGKTPSLRERIQKEKTPEKNVARRLLVDHGWCSTSVFFLLGGSDTSDYCADSQTCDSWWPGGVAWKPLPGYIGCNGGAMADVTSCCIVHDKCLEAPTHTDGDGNVKSSRSPASNVCPTQDCTGSRCDVNLGNCAWSKSCWDGIWYDFQCGALMGALKLFMGGYQPQAEWNTGGKNTDSCCQVSQRANVDCANTPVSWRNHRHSPHRHSPHRHNPHGHWPHWHSPGW